MGLGWAAVVVNFLERVLRAIQSARFYPDMSQIFFGEVFNFLSRQTIIFSPETE